ncbi:hypothetical protein FJU58_18870 [Acinetobacter baumannii]|uniref:hypothetical protein n=1 Tax=Acinetobacter baumannii TaxID=470 RepID=UPI00112B2B63|nr:hypothetical protein [Acinetobacter baumannii]TPT70633.1 hypothetical protein FJU58_18870 [Acinetobacter baumannii]
MSEFKEFQTGDYVVLVKAGTRDYLLQVIDHKYTNDLYRVKILATGQCGPVFKDEIRPAKKEEVESGYRIDNPCKCCNGHGEVGNMLESFVCPECNGDRVERNDLGDDFPIENRISPLCKSKDV